LIPGIATAYSELGCDLTGMGQFKSGAARHRDPMNEATGRSLGPTVLVMRGDPPAPLMNPRVRFRDLPAGYEPSGWLAFDHPESQHSGHPDRQGSGSLTPRIASYRGGQTFEWPGGQASGIQDFPIASIRDCGTAGYSGHQPANRPDVGMTSVRDCGRPGHLKVQQSSSSAVQEPSRPAAWRSSSLAAQQSSGQVLQRPGRPAVRQFSHRAIPRPYVPGG